MKQFKLSHLFSMIAIAAMCLNSCVNDDDFDVPPLPSTDEIAEIISLGGDNPVFLSCFLEDFESFEEGQTAFPGYENISTVGTTRIWEVAEFADNQYLLMSSFASDETNATYFVVPVNFDEADEFSFSTQDRFNNGEVLSILLVTDYTIADNIVEATISDITGSFTIATGTTGAASQPFVPSGAYNLDGVTGNGFIAFKYEGSDIDGATTNMHIDNITIVDTDDADCDLTSGGGGGPSGGGGDNATPQSCAQEDFQSFDEFVDMFDAYENVATEGDRLWRVREFDNNKYIETSAFQGSPVQDEWFLYNVDFDTADEFSFLSKDGFNNGDPLSILWSTDHVVGNSVLDATWNDITSSFTIATGTTSGFADNFTESGAFDLSGISGQGFIAFRYLGGTSSITTTIQIDDITVVDNDDMDCDLGGGGGTGMACSEDDFESYTEFDTDLMGYQNIATGDESWTVRQFDNNQYIQMSAFNTAGAQDSWFIVGVNFDAAETVSFETKDGFNNGDALTVLWSGDYDEQGDPSTATWNDITAEFTLATGSTSGFADTFTPSGAFDLAALTGMGYMAFRYQGDAAGVTTNFQVDNLLFTSADGADCTFDLMPLGGGGGGGAATILISELADPNNNSNARFVELWNYGTEAVDLTGWSLQRWTNANTEVTASSRIDLVGMIAPGEAFVVAKDAVEFETVYGFAPDQADSASSADSNGDDQIGLFNPEGTLHDIFGVPGEDGSNTNHEFEDGRARRKATVMMANTTYDFAEWDIWNDTGDADTINEPQDAPGAFTPGVHPDDNGSGGGDGAGLIITEYAEGSGNNKYIEIYNATADAIDLSNYRLQRASGGTGWEAASLYNLSGTLAAGALKVYAHESADDTGITGSSADIEYISPSISPNPTFYNGDDAVGLWFDDGAGLVLIDKIGDPDMDPGTAWDVAGVAGATRDHTLVRKSTINTPNLDWPSSAGTNADDSEWIVLDQNDFTNIGIR